MNCEVKFQFGNGEVASFSVPNEVEGASNIEEVLNYLSAEELLEAKRLMRESPVVLPNVDLVNINTIVGTTSMKDMQRMANLNLENIELRLINNIINSLSSDLNDNNILLVDSELGELETSSFENEKETIVANAEDFRNKDYHSFIQELIHYKYDDLLKTDENFSGFVADFLEVEDVYKVRFEDFITRLNEVKQSLRINDTDKFTAFSIFSQYLNLGINDMLIYSQNDKRYSKQVEFTREESLNKTREYNELLNDSLSKNFFEKSLAENRDKYYYASEATKDHTVVSTLQPGDLIKNPKTKRWNIVKNTFEGRTGLNITVLNKKGDLENLQSKIETQTFNFSDDFGTKDFILIRRYNRNLLKSDYTNSPNYIDYPKSEIITLHETKGPNQDYFINDFTKNEKKYKIKRDDLNILQKGDFIIYKKNGKFKEVPVLNVLSASIEIGTESGEKEVIGFSSILKYKINRSSWNTLEVEDSSKYSKFINPDFDFISSGDVVEIDGNRRVVLNKIGKSSIIYIGENKTLIKTDIDRVSNLYKNNTKYVDKDKTILEETRLLKSFRGKRLWELKEDLESDFFIKSEYSLIDLSIKSNTTNILRNNISEGDIVEIKNRIYSVIEKKNNKILVLRDGVVKSENIGRVNTLLYKSNKSELSPTTRANIDGNQRMVMTEEEASTFMERWYRKNDDKYIYRKLKASYVIRENDKSGASGYWTNVVPPGYKDMSAFTPGNHYIIDKINKSSSLKKGYIKEVNGKIQYLKSDNWKYGNVLEKFDDNRTWFSYKGSFKRENAHIWLRSLVKNGHLELVEYDAVGARFINKSVKIEEIIDTDESIGIYVSYNVATNKNKVGTVKEAKTITKFIPLNQLKAYDHSKLETSGYGVRTYHVYRNFTEGIKRIEEYNNKVKNGVEKIDLSEFSEMPNVNAFITSLIGKLKDVYGLDIELISSDGAKDLGFRMDSKGLIDNGTIYLNVDNMTNSTVMHEMMHLYLGVLKSKKYDIYKDIINAANADLELYNSYREAIEDSGRKMLQDDLQEEIFVKMFSDEMDTKLSKVDISSGDLDSIVVAMEEVFGTELTLDKGEDKIDLLNTDLKTMFYKFGTNILNGSNYQFNKYDALGQTRLMGIRNNLVENGILGEDCK